MRSEYQANRELSMNKGKVINPYVAPRKRKSRKLTDVLWWMAYVVMIAITYSIAKGAI